MSFPKRINVTQMSEDGSFVVESSSPANAELEDGDAIAVHELKRTGTIRIKRCVVYDS